MRLCERVAGCQNRRIRVAQPPPAVCREAAIDVRPPADHSRGRLCHTTGFTLIEMLVVMGIIVLALAMAIPTIRYLTGSKSEQSAENVVAAMLARARSDAIGLQQPMGVLFAIDNASDRDVVMEVQQTIQPNDPGGGVVYLDIVPNRDNLLLPPGIRVWTIKDTYTSGLKDPFPNYRYLGYNDSTYASGATMDKLRLGGVILFDGQGNLLVVPYGFRWAISSASGTTFTPLSQGAYTTPSSSPLVWPSASAGAVPLIYLRSQVGFVLVDRETFQNQERQLPTPPATNFDGNQTGGNVALDPWLDVNTTPLLVNRYNGTLTRAE